jgi:hypothetical protein
MEVKYTKWPLNIKNGSKIDGISIKFTNMFHRKTLQNFPKLALLGLKIYYLATLACDVPQPSPKVATATIGLKKSKTLLD